MKVALLTMTRTRSSVLLDTICQYYKIENFFEHYSQQYNDEKINSFYKIREKKLFDEFARIKKKETEFLFSHSSFGLKIFPHSYIPLLKEKSSVTPSIECYPLFTKDSMLDLNFYFNLNQYDKIILLNRHNIVDNIISQLYALQVGTFLLNDKNKSRWPRIKPNGKLYLTSNDKYVHRSRIYSHLLIKHLPKYLNNLNIKYEELDYDEVPLYLKINYPSVKSQFIDTEFDYKNGITNYNEVKEEIENLYNECLTATDWDRLFD